MGAFRMTNEKDNDSSFKPRQLWRLFGVTYVAMLNVKKKVILEPAGIHFSRAWALWGLKAMDRPTTITEMSQILDRDRQATAQLLKRMEKDGLVNRNKSDNSKNLITVSLTSEGEALSDRIVALDEASGEIMSCLTDAERDVFGSCLQKLHKEALARIALHTQSFPHTYAAKLGILEAQNKEIKPDEQ